MVTLPLISTQALFVQGPLWDPIHRGVELEDETPEEDEDPEEPDDDMMPGEATEKKTKKPRC